MQTWLGLIQPELPTDPAFSVMDFHATLTCMVLARSKEQLLSSVPLFADLEPSELHEILAVTQPFDVAPGETLCEQSDAASGMYILEQGRVRVSARLLGEGEVELTTLGPGDVLGEIALVDSGARSATVRGVDRAIGYFIPQRHFDLLRLTLRPAAIKVMRQLSPQVCARLRTHYHEIARLTPRNVPPCAALSAAFAPPRPSTSSTSALLRPERLRELPAFQAFDLGEIEQMLGVTRVLEFDRGVEIFAEDAAAEDCFIIVRGAIQQVVTQDEAIECVATLGPGRMFGHLELIDGGRRAVSSRARENCVLLALDAKAFGTLYAGSHPPAVKFIDAALTALVEAARLATRQVVRMTAEGRMRPSVFPRSAGVSS